MADVKLGDRMCDVVTGFEGVATARIEYFHGETQMRLERAGDAKAEWFPIGRLVPAPKAS